MTELTLAERRIPGNARKWEILRQMDDVDYGLTVRDFADLYNCGDPPPTGEALNGTPWQLGLSHCAADLRYLRSKKFIRYTGKQREGWGQGNPGMWEITPLGRQHLDILAAQRADREKNGTRSEQRVRRAAARVAARERGDAAAQAYARVVASRGSMTRAQRRKLVMQLRDKGCTYEQIGRAFGLTPEWARLEVRAANGIPRTRPR